MFDQVRERVEGVRRIAVLRANALGDFIFVLPALAALRAAYPEAELVLLGAPWHAQLLADRPGPVDRVLVVPPAEGIRTATDDEVARGATDDEVARGATGDGPGRSMEQFLAAARRERFDLALQLHGGGANSNPLVRALGARVTAGLRAEDAPPLDRWLRYVFYQPEVFRYLEVAALVGAEPVTVLPRLEVTDRDLAQVRAVLGEAGRPRVALHPGATDPRRRWPVERFAEVARELAGSGYDVLVTGSAGEAELTERVVQLAGGIGPTSGIDPTSGKRSTGLPVRSLAGQLSLGGLLGLYLGCQLVISNDTGPVHVAAAVGTPTIGIFWVGNVINCATPLRGRHRPIVSWTIHCPVCGVDCSRDLYPDRPGGGGPGCGHRTSFVHDVPVAEVLAAVADLTGSADEPTEAAAEHLLR